MIIYIYIYILRLKLKQPGFEEGIFKVCPDEKEKQNNMAHTHPSTSLSKELIDNDPLIFQNN
jgi:hypothetical protein